MKKYNILSAMTGMVMVMIGATGCEGEKDLVIIEGNLPIKTSTLYMVGDATPNGWSIDSPTPLTATEDDPLVFTWEGQLYTGEMKLCLTPGSWDAPFIRPMEHGTEISRDAIAAATFDMHAGDPDNKWRVAEAGVYRLTFDLRNWTMSTAYLRGLDGPVIEPIEAEAMYLVGPAAPCGWNIDEPTALQKTGAYTYVYEGKLKAGELKGYITTGNWDAPAIRPASAGVKIGRDGVESDDFVYAAAPDNKWEVEEAGNYRLTFDLENWKIQAEFTGDIPYEDPLLTATEVYMIGDATPGGWGWDGAIVMEQTKTHVFTWTGQLATGSIKASLEKDYSASFIRPASPDVAIGEDGVAEPGFVFTASPDDKWYVTVAGIYTIALDLENHTITARYGGGEIPDEPVRDPLEASDVYIIGSAAPCGWNIDAPTRLTRKDDYTFVYEGVLKVGEMKAYTSVGNWDVDHIRPASEGVVINSKGVSDPEFVYAGDPDFKWNVEEMGNYRLTFDLRKWTIKAEMTGAIDPLLSATEVYMIGEACPAGWSLDDCLVAKPTASNKHVFKWTGTLKTGSIKASVERDFGAPFIRPASDGVEISEKGVAQPGFVFTTSPDDKWNVVKAGSYTLTFDLENHTIAAEYLD